MVDKQELLEQLRQLKQKIHDDPQVRALYDLDGDGRISGEEWEKARQEVIRFMEIQETRREKEAGEPSAAVGATGMALAGVAGAADCVFQQIKNGAPQTADSDSTPSLLNVPEIIIKQEVEGLELMTDFEGRNRYGFSTADGRALGRAEEAATGLGGTISRLFLTSRRPFTMGIHALNTAETIRLKRRFELIFSRIDVTDNNEMPVGNVQQRFGLINRKYDLIPADGKRTLRIRGPLFKPWTFYIMDGDQQVGLITKKWSGLLKEAFSRADTFSVHFEDPGITAAERKLILGTAIAIDMDYFEQSQN